MNPVNLAVRFLLEVSTLFIIGLWGWRQGSGGWQTLFAVSIPLMAAAIWGIFAVPNDPSRSGSTPLPVPGIVRLAIELGLFASAAWALYDLGFSRVATLFGTAVVLHYPVSFDRLRWLVSQ